MDDRMMITAIGLAILVGSVILFVALMTIVLPRTMLKISYGVDKPRDRGTKKCLFDGKNCIVYTSSKENKQFIKQYALVQEDGHKSLTCKLTPIVGYIDYDIILFNRYNKVFKVMNVKEDILGNEMTRTTVLPDETAYISIVIRRVNKSPINKSPTVKMKGKSIVLFSLVAMLLTAVEGFVVRACCSYSFGGVFRESFISSMEGIIFIGILSVFMGILGGVSVALSAKSRARK